MVTWLTDDERRGLLDNGLRAASDPGFDPPPLVRLFTPDGYASWLLTELDPHDPDLAYGLCDAGIGQPETGHVRLSELAALTGATGMPVERDWGFMPVPSMTLSVLERMAAEAGRIVT